MDVGKELARHERRAKVMEEAISRLFAGIPGGSIRAATFRDELAKADPEPVVYAEGDKVLFIPTASSAEVLEWSQDGHHGLIRLLDTEERVKVGAEEIRKQAA